MALIEDLILNSPFLEPARHFKFDEDGITNEMLNGEKVHPQALIENLRISRSSSRKRRVRRVSHRSSL